jgi:hypothetical protein
MCQLLLQGIRMTVPGLEVTAGARQGMPRIWADIGTASWPGRPSCGYVRKNVSGRDLNPMAVTCGIVFLTCTALRMIAGQSHARCVRGPSAPKSQCVLTTKFLLSANGTRS